MTLGGVGGYEFPEANEFLSGIFEEYDIGFDDIDGIFLDYNERSDSWELTLNAGDDGYAVDFGSDLPDWVWDELYYLADIHDWEWYIQYE